VTLKPVNVSAKDEQELFMHLRHNIVTGYRNETPAQTEVRKHKKHHE